MGTRSLTYFYQDGKPFSAFYRQYDGYPDGHGATIGEILAAITLVNGYQSGQEAGKFANGPGCLAAQIITALKSECGIGGIYMINPNPEDNKDGWQEFEYHIFIDTVGEGFKSNYTSRIECRDPERVIFSGSFEDFYVWAQNPPRNPEGEYLVTTGRKAKATKTRVYRDLRDALQHESVRVRFTKADGSKRIMNCTTDINAIPDEFLNVASDKPLRVDPKLYKVFDLDKQAWRSFREERIIDWNIN
jgi:hypothetical protein